MSEFGHRSMIGNGFCLDAWGAGPFTVEVKGKTYRFEDSDRFGPALLRKDGELRKNPCPGQRNPFWVAHRCWVKQGRRLRDDGETCIWDRPKGTVVRFVGGGNFEIVEPGDEDGEIEVIGADK